MVERETPSLPALLWDVLAFGRRRCATTLGAMLAGAVLEGTGLALLVPLLGVLGGAGGGALGEMAGRLFAVLGVTGQIGRLAVLLGAFVLLVVLRGVVLARRDRIMAELQSDFVEARRARLLAAIAEARWGEIAGLRHARILHALDDNLERTLTAVAIVFQLAAAGAMLAIQWLLVAALAPTMAIAALVLGAMGAAALVPAIRRANRLGRTLAAGRLRLFDGASQLLGGLKLAMAQNLQHAFVDEFRHAASDLADRRLEQMARFSRSRIAGTTIGALAGAALVLAGVVLGTPLLALAASLVVFARMIGPATLIQQVAQQISGYLPSYAALAALTEELEAQADAGADRFPLPDAPTIAFDGVDFLHDGRTGLSDVAVMLRPGEMIGLIGGSGAGKTTFVDLIAGLLQPQRGAIRIGDVPLGPATLRTWRDRIAYVGQDSYLFNDTVRRNLTFGQADRDDAALWQALAFVGVDTLVEAMSDRLETMVGERGARLSGGQRQRIALARALLRRPDLLVLDEATNAIDIEGERAILDRLAALDPRPTILVVAHRPETLAWCDRLLRFADGRLVADEAGPQRGPCRRGGA